MTQIHTVYAETHSEVPAVQKHKLYREFWEKGKGSTDHHGWGAESSQRATLQNARAPSSGWTSSFPELGMPEWEVRSSVDGELLRFLSQRTTARAALQSIQFRALNKTALNRRDSRGRHPGNCRANPRERNINCSSKKKGGRVQRAKFGSHRTDIKGPAFFM